MYLKGTLKIGLNFPTVVNKRRASLIGYSDVDWYGDKMVRSGISGYVLLYNEATISLYTKKRPILSFCDAKYITFASCQSILLDSLLMELKCKVQKPMNLMIDNKSTIKLTKNPVSHGISKHIEIRFHFMREQVI